jgi:hypothetical protein
MDDEGFIMPQGSGLWVFTLVFCATILFRTGAEYYPIGVDIFFAIIIGGLALALVKLVSYVIREYLLDILFASSGDAPVIPTRATQTITSNGRSDEPTGVRTSPPMEPAFMNDGFITVGNKSVRLTSVERDELLLAISRAQRKPDERVYFTESNALENKLVKLGLFNDWNFTEQGKELFNING